MPNVLKIKENVSIFAFTGNDTSGKDLALQNALKKWLGPLFKDDLAKEVYYGDEICFDKISEAYETVSMFSEKKAIILKSFDKVPVSSQNQLADLLKNPNDSSGIFIVTEKLDGRSQLYKTIKKTGQIIDYKLPWSNKIPPWLSNYASTKYKRSLSSRAAFLLWEYIGDDLKELEQELEKLDLYLPDKAPITEEDIIKLIVPHRNNNIFEFKKRMGLRHKGEALKILRSMLDQGDPPFLLTIQLFNHFLQLLNIHMLHQKGLSPIAIYDRLKISKWIFEKENYLAQANSRSEKLWKKILIELSKLEADFKRGRYSERFEVELAFARFL
ncbi:MAG: DNA polymerase III subunit delta [Fibrobacteria bacterium]|nr:DNA polymerase III subunit delta [Fibrobacteria bacterium]